MHNTQNNGSTTLDDILAAINESSTAIEQRLQNLETEVDSIKTDVKSIRAEMVTKPYLDDKLGDLKGDIIVTIRKEDTKLKALVEILKKRNVISPEDVKQILTLEPFAQMLL